MVRLVQLRRSGPAGPVGSPDPCGVRDVGRGPARGTARADGRWSRWNGADGGTGGAPGFGAAAGPGVAVGLGTGPAAGAGAVSGVPVAAVERAAPAGAVGPPGVPEPPPYGRTAREERTAALVDAVRLRLAESGAAPTVGSVAAALRAERAPLGDGDVLDTVRALRAELVGAGPLDRLLAMPDVTDVLVNGPDEVWIDRGGGLQRAAGVGFADAEAVRRLAHRLATAAGRRLDDARPWVDARLPDGTRLHAMLPPIAAGCTHISLRVCRPRPFTLDELAAGGALPPEGVGLLAGILRARLSLLISGGAGTGKTTLLMYHRWKSSRSPPL